MANHKPAPRDSMWATKLSWISLSVMGVVGGWAYLLSQHNSTPNHIATTPLPEPLALREVSSAHIASSQLALRDVRRVAEPPVVQTRSSR